MSSGARSRLIDGALGDPFSPYRNHEAMDQSTLLDWDSTFSLGLTSFSMLHMLQVWEHVELGSQTMQAIILLAIQ
eukprot:2548300-Amphidinium_carterae.1